MPISMRPARQADSKAIKDLIRRVHINPTGLDWQHFTLAVDEQQCMIGCAQMKPHGDGSRELASLAVEEQYRGQGIATVLIEALLSKEQPPIYLMCKAELVPFYEKFNFRLVAERDRPPYYRKMWRVLGIIRFFIQKFDGPSLMVWQGSA
jgi:N-acetylglutamate synthase-like GNAT family acetyltransferase